MERCRMCQNMSGLSTAEVEFRKKAGLSNECVDSSTKTVAQIIRSNVVTYYNLIFLIITILLIVVGSFRDLTFLPIIIANMLIGIIQELRSKKILDDLTILNTPKITVRRNGSDQEVLADELVQDDVITLSAGGQIPADALVLSGNITVNEALITGEADEIIKKEGDPLFSGSFVISGECLAKLEKVGKDSYISGPGNTDKRGRAVGDDPGVEPPCADRGRDHLADRGDPVFTAILFFRGNDER